jgi:hypothetical protein
MVRLLGVRVGTYLLVTLLATVFIALQAASPSHAAGEPVRAGSAVLRIDGSIALASLMSLGDTHLQKVADSLKTLADTDEARAADWEKIKGLLDQTARRNVPAVAWFALPDGTYWTVEQGRIAQTLADRPYFPRLLAGETVMGDLVISRSTGKCVAVVAVPIVRDGSVVGVLGSSIYLDRLSGIINKEMSLDNTMIFYSFDAQPLVALVWDPQLVFLEPMKEKNESLKGAFKEMLAKGQGTVTYEYRGRMRTVIYRKSPVTKWWYAFGIVRGGREVQ